MITLSGVRRVLQNNSGLHNTTAALQTKANHQSAVGSDARNSSWYSERGGCRDVWRRPVRRQPHAQRKFIGIER